MKSVLIALVAFSLCPGMGCGKKAVPPNPPEPVRKLTLEEKVVGNWEAETLHSRYYAKYKKYFLLNSMVPSSEDNASSNVIKRNAKFPYGFPGTSAGGEWWVEDGQVVISIRHSIDRYSPPIILTSMYRMESAGVLRRIKLKEGGKWIDLPKDEQELFKKMKVIEKGQQ